MNKVVTFTLLAVVLAVALSWRAASVQAYPEFKEEFDKKYVKDANVPGIAAEEKALSQAAGTAKCNICHVKGENKKVRNSYGEALDKLLDKGDKKNVAKINKALDSAADEKSDPNVANSPTFGELIKSGKLPGKDPPPKPANPQPANAKK
ncbi:MAG TPA: hypothetical protein VMF30_07770 [Pirellulales bacterium]|nr:hypothetical protein [Pirellulales bacterium]